MLPIQLELKNFLPYRSPDPVRFEGVHLACLTGANGAGKSSLLDAITWVLWGEARARRDDDLIHMGQDDMHVQLDFEQEGNIYRVLRRRSRGRRGQSSLDLWVRKSDDEYQLKTEPSMRATQQSINELLRLDYRTFVHSAFLQQGKADAFTTQPPAERKKILSDILGLEQWARYEAAAKERLSGIAGNINYFNQSIAEIDEQLARKPMLEADRDNAQESYEAARAALESAEKRRDEVAYAPGKLDHIRQMRADRESQLRERNAELTDVQTRIGGYEMRIAEYEETLAAREEIESGYAALQSAREANQALSDKLMQLSSLKDRHNDLVNQIDRVRTRLESEADGLHHRISELEASAADTLDNELAAVQDEVAELEAREQEQHTLTEALGEMSGERGHLEAQKEALTVEGKNLSDRLQRLEATGDDVATCPLCGQPLTAAARDRLLEEVNAEIETRREKYRRTQEAIIAVHERMVHHRDTLQAMKPEVKRLAPLRERVGVLQTQAQARQDATIQLAAQQKRLADIQQQLAEEAFALAERQALAELDAQQATLGYDSGAHEDTRQQLEDYQTFEQRHTALSVAIESLEGLQADLNDACARRDRLNKSVLEMETEIAALDAEMTQLEELVREFNEREAEVRTQRTLERNAYERLVNARQALDALTKQAERKNDLIARRDEARQQEAVYTELRDAFGKNGVPAMVIETAIPELEAAANQLLARMTDGRMSLRFNTQREKVTGGVTETLDIEIADELGTRAYEMYSGGEAFRINFAIRVALSQMLARRAGAHLRTLFIDEGFGTQDENGRDKLVEAINAIQDAFSMVLVITHIDDLRDNFPVHIVVDKTTNGSRISLL
jgi:DNA repair protein SbcC/Rad50